MTTSPSVQLVEPVFGNIPLSLVQESTTNPRKRFDPVSLAELSQSIKLHGVGQPILVRPHPDKEGKPDCVEIVAGARRYRASKLADMPTIPAIVRDLTDEQVIVFQVIENLQREDVHPIEEAEGYDNLMKTHGYTADQLAREVGKSKAYVYGRLKLTALSLDTKTAFYDGLLSPSTALLVARIPVPSLQEKATKEITSFNGGDPMSYRRAVEHIQNRYMLRLDSAPFSVEDTKLVPAAGACTTCPKRTGNQPELFGDVDSADVCIDPDCFASKRVAFNDRILAAAKKQGIPIHKGSGNIYESIRELREVDSSLDLLPADAQLWNFERRQTDTTESINDVLTPEQLPKPHAYARLADGHVCAIYERSAIQNALEKAGLCITLAEYTKRMKDNLDGEPEQKRDARVKGRDEENRALDLRVQQENDFRVALYKKIRAHRASGITATMMRPLVQFLVQDLYSLPHDLIDYDFDASSPDTVCAYLDKADFGQIEKIFMDVVIGDALSVSRWELDDMHENNGYKTLLEMAKVAQVDVDAVRAATAPAPAVEEPAAAEQVQEAKPKKAKASKKEKTAPAIETPATEKPSRKIAPVDAWPFPTAAQIEEKAK